MNPCFSGLRLLPLAAALACPPAAHAAEPNDLKELREQLRQLRDTYESRISALEKRLAEAEQSAGRAEQNAVKARETAQAVAAAPAPVAPPATETASESAFNPALSLILAGNATRLSRDPASYRIGGFVPSLGEVAPAPKSFSLGESELSLAANIDHLFRGQLTASVAPEGGQVNIEEGYIQTLALGHGATLKAGRFLSAIGYLNEQHSHVWDFADAPLAYKAFFGGQLKNDGVQLKWLAPTEETLLEIGAESAKGGAFPSTNNSKNGSTLNTVFAHAGGDVGASHTWRAGLSYLETSPQNRADSADSTLSSFSFTGRSRTAMADFVWKWAPEGNATRTSFKLQGEWVQRREDGDLSMVNGGGSGTYRSRQSGGYLQGVYQFMPAWRVGVRYDRLAYGSVDAAVPLPAILAPWNPKRTSVMTDWSPSEFSRFRLQFARDEARPGESDNQLWLQYIVSLGAHGAHKY